MGNERHDLIWQGDQISCAKLAGRCCKMEPWKRRAIDAWLAPNSTRNGERRFGPEARGLAHLLDRYPGWFKLTRKPHEADMCGVRFWRKDIHVWFYQAHVCVQCAYIYIYIYR